MMLSLENISFRPGETTILKNIDLTVSEHEIITIVGPNGAGKSTLLNIALGLIQPTSGKVNRRKNLTIGYVPQLINRDYTMPISVTDFVSLARTKKNKVSVQQLLKELGLGELKDALLSNLSGGELRRALFARSLIATPELLVLDELTAGIDFVGQEDFYHQINILRNKYGFSILMVSHDLHLVMSATDRVICLNTHICCQGKPSYVLEDEHYLALFGRRQPIKPDAGTPAPKTEIAFYEHQHDHKHQ